MLYLIKTASREPSSTNMSEPEVLDVGALSHRMRVVGIADPSGVTKFEIPPQTLAQSMGVHAKDPCLLGSLAHTLSYESAHAPFPLGIVATAGDHPLGGHATHTVSSKEETGGYHVVAGRGPNSFHHDPVHIDISHPGSVHSNVVQMVKRGTRWSDDVGKTASQLLSGLESHEGTTADGTTVHRVLVPVDGNHPCSRALRLNAESKDGPFSQYSKSNRKLVKVAGADHIIVEKSHLQDMANTLESNLAPATKIGRHGITFHFKPLPGVNPDKHKRGKVVVDIKIGKHRASDVLAKGPDFKHDPHLIGLNALQARTILDGVSPDTAAADPVAAEHNLKVAVLSAKLAPAKQKTQINIHTMPTRGLGEDESDDAQSDDNN